MIILAQGKKKLDHFELILTPKTIIKNSKKKKNHVQIPLDDTNSTKEIDM